MGRVEKFTVLAVLLLIAIILVVSMTTDKPVDKSRAAVLGEKPSTPAQASNEVSAAAPGEQDSKLLSATVGTPLSVASPAPAPAGPQPLAIPSGSLLKTTEGLAEGFDSARMLYTWQSGDTYVNLAKKYYGVPTKFTLIKNANEGREDIPAGEKILVPIFDVENVAAEPPAAPEAKPEAKTEVKKSNVAKAAPVSTGGRSHTVKKGESLWKIAKAELGDGGRWQEIYDLNKDKLKSPEALRDGMKLQLP